VRARRGEGPFARALAMARIERNQLSTEFIPEVMPSVRPIDLMAIRRMGAFKTGDLQWTMSFAFTLVSDDGPMRIPSNNTTDEMSTTASSITRTGLETKAQEHFFSTIEPSGAVAAAPESEAAPPSEAAPESEATPASDAAPEAAPEAALETAPEAALASEACSAPAAEQQGTTLAGNVAVALRKARHREARMVEQSAATAAGSPSPRSLGHRGSSASYSSCSSSAHSEAGVRSPRPPDRPRTGSSRNRPRPVRR